MEAKIDRFGRILIPRELRGRLGLKSGASLRLEAGDGVLILVPAGRRHLLEDEDGLLVFAGEADSDLDDAVAALRGDRIAALGSEVVEK